MSTDYDITIVEVMSWIRKAILHVTAERPGNAQVVFAREGGTIYLLENGAAAIRIRIERA